MKTRLLADRTSAICVNSSLRLFRAWGVGFVFLFGPLSTHSWSNEPQVIHASLQDFQATISDGGGTSEISDGILNISSGAKPKTAWVVQLVSRSINRSIREGDVIEFSFEGRSVESAAADNSSLVTVYFAKSDPWEVINTNEGASTVFLESHWKEIHCVARADREFDSDTVFMAMHCSATKQSIDIRNPKLLFWGDVPDSTLPVNELRYEGQEPSASWRYEAENRIREHRTSPVTVRVTNAKGEPVVGAKIRLKQRTHSYAFGSFTDSMPLKTGADAERYRKTMRQYFNRVTLPRCFADWGTDTPEGKITADNMAEWAAAEGYQLKTHLLLYPYYLPDRVVQLRDNAEAFKREIELAMDDALARTAKFPMHSWDALNELRASKIVAEVLGESYYASIVNRGHEIQPNAKWFINDFDVIEKSPNQLENIEEYEATIKKIIGDGGKLTGIGFQGHFSEVVTPIPKVLEILDRFATFNLAIEITEFDIDTRDEAGQADYTRDLLTAFFSHPSTTGFTCSGFWEGAMWRPRGAMIRDDWSIKPNGRIWNELIKKRWWTDESVVSGSDGTFILPAFHGRHHIEIETESDFFSKDILVDKEPLDINVSLPSS